MSSEIEEISGTYEKNLEIREDGKGRIYILEKSVESDIIPGFLKVGVPKNDAFRNQAVRGFQLRLLKTELSKARENQTKVDARADSIRSELCQARL